MAIRVIPGEIVAKDATTRATIPSSSLPRWPPFERVAETIATPRRAFPPHKHEGVEVLTYVIEGSATYALGTDAPVALVPGATMLLTAPTSVAHAINTSKGHTVRWFSMVLALPKTATGSPRLQSHLAEPSAPQPDGTVVHHLVGPGSPVTSAIGVESVALDFRAPGVVFRKTGHDRAAIVYALAGHGTVDDQVLDGGEAALVQDASGLALHGQAGFRVIFASAPHPP